MNTATTTFEHAGRWFCAYVTRTGEVQITDEWGTTCDSSTHGSVPAAIKTFRRRWAVSIGRAALFILTVGALTSSQAIAHHEHATAQAVTLIPVLLSLSPAVVLALLGSYLGFTLTSRQRK